MCFDDFLDDFLVQWVFCDRMPLQTARTPLACRVTELQTIDSHQGKGHSLVRDGEDVLELWMTSTAISSLHRREQALLDGL